MRKYRLTPTAKSDFVEIWNYSVEAWGEMYAKKSGMTQVIGNRSSSISMNIQMLSSVMVYARNVQKNITLTSTFMKMSRSCR